MSLYLDTSALLKRYIKEAESEPFSRLTEADGEWITAQHTYVETRRNLSRLLSGAALKSMQRAFESDWLTMHIVQLDEVTCKAAAEIAEITGARTLDALHLAAARRLGALTFVTYDLRQAQVARTLGMSVLGA